MAYNEVAWDYPQYAAYSVLNAVVPLVCWNPPQNNPFISLFEVEYLDTVDGQWIRLGTTAANYIRFPSDVYSTNSSYRIRITTIGINGKRSPYSYSTVVLASPLVFDFTASQDVRFADGTIVPNQRYLFLAL
jgi:hypothetical protein